MRSHASEMKGHRRNSETAARWRIVKGGFTRKVVLTWSLGLLHFFRTLDAGSVPTKEE
jgi:hypothetical protein